MNITVIGAGHGGQALAAYLAYMGFRVVLYNRTESVIADLKNKKKIRLTGIINKDIDGIHFTSSMEVALKKSEIIIVSVPANAHEEIAQKMANHVTALHMILLHPGRTMGAFKFKKYLAYYGCKVHPLIAETDTFILTSRKLNIGWSNIVAVKKEVHIATDYTERTAEVRKLIHIFPMLQIEKSTLFTSLNNIGSIFHPVPAILNIGRIENNQEYLHYKEGITPSICRILNKIDNERLTIAQNFGILIPSAEDWIRNVYGSKGNALYELIQNTDAYKEVKISYETFQRYIYEDIPNGIVPMYYMSKCLHIEASGIKTVIDLANLIFDYDFYKSGTKNQAEDYIAIQKSLHD